MIYCADVIHSERKLFYLFTDVLFTKVFSPVLLIFLFLVLQCDVTANSLTAPAADNATMLYTAHLLIQVQIVIL